MGSITITQAPDAKITRHPDGAIEVWDVPNESAVFDNRPTASEAYRRGPAPAAEAPAAGGGAPSQAKPYASDLAVMFHPELGNLTNTNIETRTTTAPSDEFTFPHSRVVNWEAGAVVTLPWPASGQETTAVRASEARGVMRFRFTPPAGLPDKTGYIEAFEAPGTFFAANLGLWPAGFSGQLQRVSEQMQFAFYVGGPGRDGVSVLTPEAAHDLIIEIVDGPNSGDSFAITLASPAR